MVNMKRRNQNQKISFPFFAGSPHTPRRRRKSKEIFGFVIATEGSVRGAYSLHHAIGAYDLGQSHHALRACEVNQNPADFVRNTFELRPIHTAKIENRNWKLKWGRAVGATQTHSRQKFPNPKGFSTLRVALSFANTL